MNRTQNNRFSGLIVRCPASDLKPYIDCYWFIQPNAITQKSHRQFMHPSGGYGLIFNLSNRFVLDGNPIAKAVFFDSANSVSRRVLISSTSDWVGIRFRLGGAFPLFKVPLHYLNNQLEGVGDTSLTQVNTIANRLHDSSTIDEQKAILDEWLLNFLPDVAPIAPTLTASLYRLQQNSHHVKIHEIASDLYISQRQLERIFKREIGMTPKRYTQLLKVNHARGLLKNLTPDQSSAMLASQLGYFDQAHFIRSFKRVVGMTPHQYRDYHHTADK